MGNESGCCYKLIEFFGRRDVDGYVLFLGL